MDNAKRLINEYKGEGRLGVAVSGGVDSMTLLHLVLSIVPSDNVVVLNMEHGIRGEASVSDSEFVRAEAEKKGVAFIGRSVSIPERVALSGKSEETEARLARKEFFEDMLSSGTVDYVLLAHNEGDNTESVLMHLFRGSGINGLIGMREVNGKYLRPLLSVSRQKIEDYARQNGIDFVVDATNSEDKYNRNFLRNEVLPLIRSRYDIDGAIKTLSSNALLDDEYIRSTINFEQYIKVEKDSVSLDESALLLSEALSSRLIFECAKRVGRAFDITAKHINAIRSLIKTENGKRVEIGGTLTVAKEYGKIVFYFDSVEEKEDEEVEFTLGFTPFADGVIEVIPTDARPKKDKLVIDGDKVPEGSVIRYRRRGDEFRAFGGGNKKLKEYLIDKKIPLRTRDKLPLLCYNEKVLAIFGVEIADEVKITQKTVNAFELKYTED